MLINAYDNHFLSFFFILWSSPTSANASFTHSPPLASPLLVPVSAQVGGTSASSAGLMTVTAAKVRKHWTWIIKSMIDGNSYGQHSTIIFSMLIIFFIIKFLMLNQSVLPTSMFVVFIHFLLYVSIISTKLSEYWLHTPQVFEVIVVNICCTGCTQALLLPGWSPCSMAKGAMACLTLKCLWHATFVESLLVVRKAANS